MEEIMEKDESVRFSKKLIKRTWLDEIQYWCFYIWWNWLTDLKWRVPNYFERAYYGIGHADVWNFDYYLSTVIIRGLKQLKKYKHGCPIDIYEKYRKQKNLSQRQKDNLSSKEWKDILSITIKGFEAGQKLISPSKSDIAKFDELEQRLNKGMDLFKKHYLSLWD